MSNSGGNAPKALVAPKVLVKRSKAEWREITRLKLKQYESIGVEIVARKRGKGGDF